MNSFTTMRRRYPLVAATMISALAVAACGSSADATGAGEVDSEALALAQSSVDAARAGTEFTDPPAAGPAPKPGVNVWMINIGLASPGSELWGEGAREAGETLGWNVTVYDGKYEPFRWIEGIQQAVAADADGIVLAAVDCASVKAPLEQAKAAGIAIVGISAADCSDIDEGAPRVFDGDVQYVTGGLKETSKSLGATQADWVTATTDGTGKIIHVTYNESPQNNWQVAGFNEELAAVCPGCEVVKEVDIVTTDLYGSALREKLEQALLQNPDADAIVVPFDDVMTGSGGSAAINAAGRRDINVVATGGSSGAAFQEIREGTGTDALVALSFQWEAWAAMDGLNRILNGEQVANSGLATQLVDEGNAEGIEDYYQPPIDFRAGYRKAWGRGE